MSSATIDEQRPSRRPTIFGSLALADLPTYMPYLYALVLGSIIYALSPDLINGPGAIDIRFGLVVPLALVAFGQTLVLFTRGIDLSVGGVLSLTTALLATHLNHNGWALYAELALVLVMGAAIGALNGVLIGFSGLQPFIVTLGAWLIWNGVALAVLPIEGGAPAERLMSGVIGDIGPLPKSVWVVIALLVVWIWIRRMRVLRDLVAIGSDETRARLSGVSIVRRKVQVYAVSGMFAAAAGIWLTAQNASGSPIAGDQFILNSVAAVVLGGTSIFGGRGSVASSIVGAIVFLMIPDLVFALGIPSFWGIFLQGAILIVAVTANSLLQRRAAS